MRVELRIDRGDGKQLRFGLEQQATEAQEPAVLDQILSAVAATAQQVRDESFDQLPWYEPEE